MAGAPPTVFKVRLPCADEAELRKKFAGTLATRGIHVPTDKPLPIGARVAVKLLFRDGSPAVSGEGVVTRHGRPGKPPGMSVQFTQLDPESIQFSLAPLHVEPKESATLDALRESLLSGPAFEGQPQLPGPAGPAPESDTRKTTVHRYSSRMMQDAVRHTERDGSLRPLDMLGSYQILKTLGCGGMAEVYLARSTMAGGVEKLVAFKTVIPEFGPGTPFGAMFLNEAKVSVTFRHPNIVQGFDFGEAAGRPFLAMEYLHGRDLSDVIDRLRSKAHPPPLNMAVAVGIEVCKALQYLHDKRDLDGSPLYLVHRDVSPGNVLISELGEVKLVDFGVAAVGTAAEPENMVVGKRAYMSPEQGRGGNPRAAWDVYALGVVLHEILTLEKLFEGDSTTESLADVRRAQQLPPSASNPEVPAKLDRAVMTATDPDPDRRFPSMQAFGAALVEAQSEVGPCDLGAFMQGLFAGELAAAQREIERLVVAAREHTPQARTADGKALQPFRTVRRKVARSRLYMRMRRSPGLMWAGWSGALVLLVAIGAWAWSAQARTAQVAAHLERAEAAVRSGSLAGTQGDSALEQLLAARRVKPADPVVAQRLGALGRVFEDLGDRAVTRGNDAEAATHYQGAAIADPAGAAPRKLQALEARIRAQQRVTP